ncbi:hypothetical protein QFC19_000046 [Naganishia cerealis]|uniref:Uncharacterized protein n=1 Tax=Naganishia cerealis TaxID=610337 RepID=A0ACC2WQZ3_9TREE|nr:hypothetical protein QFC19_000046 [Naganishia cerealis]
MPAQSNPRGSTLDRSRAEPIISNPTNIGNDLGSSTIGVGTEGGLKPKRQPLTRSGGSGGNNSGSQQSLLGFSSRKAGPVTPEKKKKTAFTLGTSLKRKAEQVDAQPEDALTTGTKTALHPLFAGAKRTNDPAAGADVPVQTIILDADVGSSTSTAMEIKGISGVPQDGQWDPLLLHSSASGKPTQEMEDNLGPRRKMHRLDLTTAEQVEDAESGRARKVRGLAVRKAMIRADEKIRMIRQRKPSAAAAAAKSNTKMTGGGKSKAGGNANGKDKDQAVLDPNDKRWSKIYKESWGVMGGDSIAPSMSPSSPCTYNVLTFPPLQ